MTFIVCGQQGNAREKFVKIGLNSRVVFFCWELQQHHGSRRLSRTSSHNFWCANVFICISAPNLNKKTEDSSGSGVSHLQIFAHVFLSRLLPLPQNNIIITITSYFAWPPSYFLKPVGGWSLNTSVINREIDTCSREFNSVPPFYFYGTSRIKVPHYSVKLWRGVTFSMLPTVQTSWTVHIMQINMYFGVYQQESVSALEVLILKLFMVNKVGCCGLLEL